MKKYVLLLSFFLLGLLPACTLFQASGVTPTPTAEIGTPPGAAPPSPRPTRTRPPRRTATVPATPTRLPTATTTHTPLPTPTFIGTPPTPTQLPQPYLINVLDWELVKATSPVLCSKCDPATITVEAPRGLPIAVVQVYIDGKPGSQSSVSTNLIYPSPESLDCSLTEETTFCGILFGQVYANHVTLTARYTGGEQHQLEYLITFQDWTEYHP